jgi:hypothetical protein
VNSNLPFIHLASLAFPFATKSKMENPYALLRLAEMAALPQMLSGGMIKMTKTNDTSTFALEFSSKSSIYGPGETLTKVVWGMDSIFPMSIQRMDKDGLIRQRISFEDFKARQGWHILVPGKILTEWLGRDGKIGAYVEMTITSFSAEMLSDDEFVIDPSVAQRIWDADASKMISIPQ